ncbi:MAG: hypothetical protein LBP37_06825 [Spirochaetaceae bacterium]|nr:hypothetical protein [Spirochaetaceae bacterium]
MKYWLNVAGPDCDNIISPYSSKKKLRRRWREDYRNYLENEGLDDSEVYPYFQIEKRGDIEEVGWREILGVAS